MKRTLQIAHLFVFIGVLLLAYGLWKITAFRLKIATYSSPCKYTIGGILLFILVGYIVHVFTQTKTRLTWWTGLSDYPTHKLWF